MTDKRYRIGIWVTGLYLITLAIYTCLQRHAVLAMEPNEMGDALAGAASPLAFLWLVLGYLQQGEELRQNTAALNLQAKELRDSVEQQRALVEATNRQHAFDLERSEQQRRTSFHAGQPLFEPYVGWEAESAREAIFSFTLRNVGQRSTKVSLKCEEGSDTLRIHGDTVLAFEQGYERRWKLHVSKESPPIEPTLVVHYTDANGEPQMQKVGLFFIKAGENKIQGHLEGALVQVYPWENFAPPDATS